MYNRIRQLIAQNLYALRQPGSFTQNLVITFSGSAAVTAIGFLLTPILSRIYPPASYGAFAVFSTIINNASLLCTLSYPGAFVLPRRHRQFLHLVQLSLVLTVGTFLLLLLGAVALGPALMRYLQIEQVGYWFYTIPFITLLFNLNLVMSLWYVRSKEFKTRSKADVMTAFGGRGITIGYGLAVGGSVGGLVLGDIVNRAIAFLMMFSAGIHRHVGEVGRTFSWRKIRAVAYEYREFPLYVLPVNYLNTLAVQIPIFMLSGSFGAQVLGYYSFSASLLELPILMISSAVNTVFLQKVAETNQKEPGQVKTLIEGMYTRLVYLSVLPFALITIYGDLIFRYAFGERWEAAGIFTGYLGFYYLFKLAAIAGHPLYTVLRKQRLALTVTGIFFLARVSGLGVGIYLHDVRMGLLLFGVASMVVTFLGDLRILSLAGLPVWRIGARTVLVLTVALAVCWASRQLLEHLWPVLQGRSVSL